MNDLEAIKWKYKNMTRQELNTRVAQIIITGLIKTDEIHVIEYKEHMEKNGSAAWES